MPDLDRVVPVLLEHGLERLPEHCRLSPGTSPGPRAGQPQPHPVHRWLGLQKPGSGLLQAPCLLAWASPLLVAVGSPLLGHLRAPLSPRVESYSLVLRPTPILPGVSHPLDGVQMKLLQQMPQKAVGQTRQNLSLTHQSPEEGRRPGRALGSAPGITWGPGLLLPCLLVIPRLSP